MVELWPAATPQASPHQALNALASLSLETANGRPAIVMATRVSLVLIYRNLLRSIAGGAMSSLFLSRTIRSRVKRGAPEHRDSGALTGSLALTPWP